MNDIQFEDDFERQLWMDKFIRVGGTIDVASEAADKTLRAVQSRSKKLYEARARELDKLEKRS